MLNRANNHLLDSEAAGMFSTNDLLDKAGHQARRLRPLAERSGRPAFLELPKGRVGFVGMHTPNGVASRRLAATDQRGNLGGRPGLNMLGYTETIVVTPQQITDLQRFRDELFQYRTTLRQPEAGAAAGRRPGDAAVVEFGTRGCRRSAPRSRARCPGTIDFTMSRADLDRIIRSVRNAASYSDFTIATIHAHQSQSVLERFHSSTKPPAFLVDLAHQTIDQGAHAFVGHGPHILRGIEIYKGRPIFYGMGEFFRQMNWSLEAEFGQADAEPGPRAMRKADRSPTKASWPPADTRTASSSRSGSTRSTCASAAPTPGSASRASRRRKSAAGFSSASSACPRSWERTSPSRTTSASSGFRSSARVDRWRLATGRSCLTPAWRVGRPPAS